MLNFQCSMLSSTFKNNHWLQFLLEFARNLNAFLITSFSWFSQMDYVLYTKCLKEIYICKPNYEEFKLKIKKILKFPFTFESASKVCSVSFHSHSWFLNSLEFKLYSFVLKFLKIMYEHKKSYTGKQLFQPMYLLRLALTSMGLQEWNFTDLVAGQ